MSHTNRMICAVFVLASLLAGCQSGKGPPITDVSTSVILTSVPGVKETVLVPTGYTKCFTVKQGFYNRVWSSAHRVCEYNNENASSIWVDGYWMCLAHDVSNDMNIRKSVCRHWAWKQAHWSENGEAY